MSRVAITGVGIIAPSGLDTEAFWRNNTLGRSYVRHEPSMAELRFRSRVVARVDGFQLDAHHDPACAAELAGLSRFVQFGATVGAMAARRAGLPTPALDPQRGAVVCSSAIGGTPEFQQMYECLTSAGRTEVQPLPTGSRLYDSVFLNFTPAWLAREYALEGACLSVTTGCTAGVDALGLAFDLVRHGESDVAIAVAAEAPLSGLAYATLDVINSLAVVDCPPEHASRPFDRRRNGFVLAEGAAAVVVEDMDHADRRGVPVLGEVLGYSSSNNATHMTDLAPDGDAMARVVAATLVDAALAPGDIDYINAHGSSTPQNDVFETRAIKSILGDTLARRTPISSTKSMIGHSLSAASLTGVIAALGALRYAVVPPTINQEVRDPECDLDYVPNRARHHEVTNALVTASGFGGIHSAAVLRRVGEPNPGWWTGLTRDGAGHA